MKAPEDRDTPSAPPNFGVEQSDCDEITNPHKSGNGHAWGEFDPFDRDALIAHFKSQPIAQQNETLLNLYMALSTPMPATRRELADHEMVDRQEFRAVNAELAHISRCMETIAANFKIQLPERPEMPRHTKETA